MALGIVHFVYAINAIVMTICFILLLKRYMSERNKITLLFSLVILSIAYICYIFIGRGLFEVNTVGSLLLYKLYVVGMAPTATFLCTFMLYPLILQRGGFSEERKITILLSLIWLVTIASTFFVILGEVSFTYTELGVDIYSVSFLGLSYIGILATPLLVGVIDMIGFAYMAVNETESFYRTRAIMLLFGWTMSVVGIVIVLIPALLILNPILFGAGAMLMAYAILRKQK